MKLFARLLLLFVVAAQAMGQVTSITVNGQRTGSVVPQGDTLRWEIHLPTGATSQNELWIDTNGNGRAEAGVDKLLFTFPQTDGVSDNEHGPGDQDGTANGVIKFQFRNGLAPMTWVFVAKNNNVADTASFTVTALPSPPYTVSGTVSVPQGTNAQWIVIEADPDQSDGDADFWMALTNANGNYTINLGAGSASLNPWRVRIDTESLGTLVAVRRDTVITLTGHHTGVNFQLIQGKVITGTVRDQNNNPVSNANPHVHDPFDQNKSLDFSGGQTDQNGFYSITVPNGKYFMHFTAAGYKDSWWNNKNSFQASDTITISAGTPDTIFNINGVVTLAALVRGRVTVNGQGAFAGISALSTTFPYNHITSTGTNERGEYDLTVDPGSYYIEFRTGDQFQYVMYYNNKTSLPADQVSVSLGQTINDINVNFIISGIEKAEAVPSTFILHQNYPNPFNPATTISYDVPTQSFVKLSVYNVLGQEVATLVSEEQGVGRYSVNFDASRLTSGMYIYRLTAGNVTMTKKMSVVK